MISKMIVNFYAGFVLTLLCLPSCTFPLMKKASQKGTVTLSPSTGDNRVIEPLEPGGPPVHTPLEEINTQFFAGKATASSSGSSTGSGSIVVAASGSADGSSGSAGGVSGSADGAFGSAGGVSGSADGSSGSADGFSGPQAEFPVPQADGSSGSADGAFGSAGGVSGSADGSSGSADGFSGPQAEFPVPQADGSSGSADGASGSAGGVSGSADGASGSADGFSGPQAEFPVPQADGSSGSADGSSGSADGSSGSADGSSGSADGSSGSADGSSGSADGSSGSADGSSGSADGSSGSADGASGSADGASGSADGSSGSADGSSGSADGYIYDLIDDLQTGSADDGSSGSANGVSAGEVTGSKQPEQIKPPAQDPGPKFTMQDIVNSGVFGEGGSEIYYSYMAFNLNNIDTHLKNSASKGESQAVDPFRFLCAPDSKCANGVMDLKHISQDQAGYFIRIMGLYGEVFIYQVEDEQIVVFEGLDIEEDKMKVVLQYMEQNKVKKVMVNLPADWERVSLIVELARFMRAGKLDLHIMGQCSSLCANYLIPAVTGNVIFEPYGYAVYDGVFFGLKQEIDQVFPLQVSQMRDSFDRENFSGDKNQQVDRLSALLGKHSQDPRLASFFERTPLGQQINLIARNLPEGSASFFIALSPENRTNVLSALSEEARASLRTLFFVFSPEVQKIDQYYDFIRKVAEAEGNYYEEIQANSSDSGAPSFFDFVILSSKLTKSLDYSRHFSVPRPYYNVPEEDKLYLNTFPSADLLRSLGVQVKGTNNISAAKAIYSDSEEAFLSLSLDDVQNCNFFAKDISFTTETLKACLLKDGFL